MNQWRNDGRGDGDDGSAPAYHLPIHSVVVVEHDMEFVRALDVPVTVLHEGSALAEGLFDTVQKDDRVIEVYPADDQAPRQSHRKEQPC